MVGVIAQGIAWLAIDVLGLSLGGGGGPVLVERSLGVIPTWVWGLIVFVVIFFVLTLMRKRR